MWNVKDKNISMVEGDYGIKLPFTVSGANLAAGDAIKLTFKKSQNGETVLEKNYDTITQNTFDLEFTEAESALFEVGSYVYAIDWYQDGNFLCNIVPLATFKVVDKA